jgi:hypothetical protein
MQEFNCAGSEDNADDCRQHHLAIKLHSFLHHRVRQRRGARRPVEIAFGILSTFIYGRPASRPLMTATGERFGNSEGMASRAPLPVAKVTFGFGNRRIPGRHGRYASRRLAGGMVQMLGPPLPNACFPAHRRPIRTESLRTEVSVSRKRKLQSRDNGP